MEPDEVNGEKWPRPEQIKMSMGMGMGMTVAWLMRLEQLCRAAVLCCLVSCRVVSNVCRTSGYEMASSLCLCPAPFPLPSRFFFFERPYFDA